MLKRVLIFILGFVVIISLHNTASIHGSNDRIDITSIHGSNDRIDTSSIHGSNDRIDTRSDIGTRFFFNESFDLDPAWDLADVGIVVFVQNSIRENKPVNSGQQDVTFRSAEVLQSTFNALNGSMASTASDRRVLGETFIASWCQGCSHTCNAQDNIVSDPTFFPVNYSLIEWHINDDHNTSETNARGSFYGIEYLPTTLLAGVFCWVESTNAENTFKNTIRSRKNDPSEVGIATFGHKENGKGWINTSVELLSFPAEGEYDVRFVIVEDMNVENNGAVYRYTARDVLPVRTIYLGNPPPVISLDSPVGCEVITGPLEILWSAHDPEGDQVNITVDYRKGSGDWFNVISDYPNTGSYYWETSDLEDGKNYRLRVLARDPEGKEAMAVMGPTFEIRNDFPPTLVLLSPVGGEIWSGEPEIRWIAYDDHDITAEINITLHYARDDGDLLLIFSNLTNTGRYLWDTGNLTDDDFYRIRVTAQDGTGHESTDTSPLPFELRNGNYEDSDGDGMPDPWEELHDLNLKSASDSILDMDVDGLVNVEEYLNRTDPNDPDTDNDSMNDGWEVRMGFDPLNDTDSPLDPDGDGLTNLQEFRHETDPRKIDTEYDGMPDAWEVKYGLMPLHWDGERDPDMDGLANIEEFLNGTDPLDTDTDGDGMTDGWEVRRALDPIDDSDALFDPDGDELENILEFKWGTNPTDPDHDNDGLPDGWEVMNKLDPKDHSDASMDGDLDGLANLEEYLNRTDPCERDSDHDGMDDGWEVRYCFDPKLPGDAVEDADDDNVSNLEEFLNDIDPLNNDTDGDGMSDGWELEFGFNPGWKNDAKGDPDLDGMNNLEEYLGGYDPRKKDRPEEDDVPDDDPHGNNGENDNGSSLGGGLLGIIIAGLVVAAAIMGFVVFYVLKRKNVVVDEASDITDVPSEEMSWMD